MLRAALLLLAMIVPLHAGRAEILSSWRGGVVVGNVFSSSGLLASWSTGVGGFVEATRRIGPLVQISSRLTARHVWYDRYRGEQLVSMPEISWFDSGEDLEALEVRFTACLCGSGEARPFFGIAGGVLLADLGKITLTGVYKKDPSRRSIVTAEGTGKRVTKAVFGVTAGMVFGGWPDGASAGLEGSLMVSPDRAYGTFELACFLEF